MVSRIRPLTQAHSGVPADASGSTLGSFWGPGKEDSEPGRAAKAEVVKGPAAGLRAPVQPAPADHGHGAQAQAWQGHLVQKPR